MVDMNEYEDGICPDCDGQVNDYGFCEDCGLDYEDFLNQTEKDWPKSWGGALLRHAKKGKKKNDENTSGPSGPGDSLELPPTGWLDVYRHNQRP